MTIYLIGSMGVGKSSLGRLVAKHLGIPFVDTDDEIVATQCMSINSIFETRGEAYFRDLETQTLKEIDSTKSIVIATGGGLPLFNNNMDHMLKSGVVVYLEMDIQSIAEQVYKGRLRRPAMKSLNMSQIKDKLSDMLAQRIPIYERAHLIFKRKYDRSQEALELSTYLRMFV